jgi:hypothetical protein
MKRVSLSFQARFLRNRPASVLRFDDFSAPRHARHRGGNAPRLVRNEERARERVVKTALLPRSTYFFVAAFSFFFFCFSFVESFGLFSFFAFSCPLAMVGSFRLRTLF